MGKSRQGYHAQGHMWVIVSGDDLTAVAVSALAWGAITIGTAFCKGYGDIMAIRLLLGIFEAGLYPSLMT